MHCPNQSFTDVDTFFSSVIYQESSFKVAVFSRRALQNNYYLKKSISSCIKPLMEQKDNISY